LYCGCITAPATLGTVIDLRIANQERVGRFFAPGDFVTVIEPSLLPTGRTYEYVEPSVTEMAAMTNCVQEVSRDDTGYYRQIIYEGITGNCSDWVNRTSTVTAGAVESFNLRVFPTSEPPRLGTFFDMDTTPYTDETYVREVGV
jgi:hypothetical protein